MKQLTLSYIVGLFILAVSFAPLSQGDYLSFILIALASLLVIPITLQALHNTMGRKLPLYVRVIACLILIGGGMLLTTPQATESTISEELGNNETQPSPEYGGIVITAKELGDSYPLTNEYCEVICRNMQLYVYADGEMYAINGTAIGALSNGNAVFRKATDINNSSIWAYNLDEGEEITEYSIRKSISPLISKGLKLCN